VIRFLAGLLSAAAAAWEGLRARLSARPPDAEAQSVLCLSVSESGWRATLLHSNGAAPEASAEEGTPADHPSATPVEVLRRAVRAISASQRERIGSVRLLIADSAIPLVDNRFARIRSTDPVAIRQAAAQELGAKDAVFGFQPFGKSSEHEVERGAYAFVSTDQARDYLGALDSLAVKLVQVVPAGLLLLPGAEELSSAAMNVRAASSTLVLADPETGVIACRELAVGTHGFAAAVAAATSISIKEAVQGLGRRTCFRTDAAADGTPAPLTATERALNPILASLRADLLASVEYFVFQRLAGAPERLVVNGEAGCVRGLSEWIGGVLELPPTVADADLHDRFVAADPDGPANLLNSAPKGLLKIGKVEYRFAEGRFRPDQPQAVRRGRPARPAGGLLRQPITAGLLREAFASVDGARAALPALALAGFGTLLWATVGSATAEMDRAGRVLSVGMAEDAVLRSALVSRTLAPQGSEGVAPLYWTEKLSAIARAVPDGMRLTKISAVADAANAARDSQLVLEGEMSTAGGDYLARITDLTDRLSGDASFMRDVASISFDGASVAHGPGHDLAHFAVTVVLGAPAAGMPGVSPGIRSSGGN